MSNTPLVVLVLPAFNEGSNLLCTLDKLQSVIKSFSNYHFFYLLIDDASKDNTRALMKQWLSDSQTNGEVLHNPMNLGLAQTLKKGHARALHHNPAFIIKTDLDDEFDYQEVLTLLLNAPQGTVVASGWKDLSQIPYEAKKRDELRTRLPKNNLFISLDPSCCGSQIHEAKVISKLLEDPLVNNYSFRWGLDCLLPLLAYCQGSKLAVGKLTHVVQNPARRTEEKIDEQYAAYEEILNQLEQRYPKAFQSQLVISK